MNEKTYTIVIEETKVQEIIVTAKDSSEAMEICIHRYKSGEFAINKNKPQIRQISVIKPNEVATEWVEF